MKLHSHGKMGIYRKCSPDRIVLVGIEPDDGAILPPHYLGRLELGENPGAVSISPVNLFVLGEGRWERSFIIIKRRWLYWGQLHVFEDNRRSRVDLQHLGFGTVRNQNPLP